MQDIKYDILTDHNIIWLSIKNNVIYWLQVDEYYKSEYIRLWCALTGVQIFKNNDTQLSIEQNHIKISAMEFA